MTDARLLTLVQWLSPGFPVGAFSWSHGVETAIADGWIGGAGDLRDWLADLLEHGSGRSDAIWLRMAAAGFDDVTLARSYQPSAERLAEADRQGAAFARLAREVWDTGTPDAPLPLAVGHAAGVLRMDTEAVVPLYLSAFVANLVTGAQRLMPLGQTSAQATIAALHPLCLSVAAGTRGATLDDIGSCAIRAEIAAMRHETLQPRLFQS